MALDVNVNLMGDILADIPHKSNSTEYMMRCPFCGDSKKDKNKMRFYILNVFPHTYYCHNCYIRGRLDNRLLDLLVFKYNVIINKSAIITRLNKLNINNRFVFNSNNNDIYRNRLHLRRRKKGGATQYLEERLGFKLKDSEIFQMNIIDDIDTFLGDNSFLGEKLSKMKKVNYYHNFIGFLTYDNNKIIMRNVNPSDTFRFCVTELKENSKDVYVIKKNNLTFKDKLKISITEGIPDAISAFKNLGYDISIGTLNSNHITSLEFIIKLCLDYKLISIDIILDNDKAGRSFKNNKKLKYFNDLFDIKFFVNTLSKDIGVRKDKILLMRI